MIQVKNHSEDHIGYLIIIFALFPRSLIRKCHSFLGLQKIACTFFLILFILHYFIVLYNTVYTLYTYSIGLLHSQEFVLSCMQNAVLTGSLAAITCYLQNILSRRSSLT